MIIRAVIIHANCLFGGVKGMEKRNEVLLFTSVINWAELTRSTQAGDCNLGDLYQVGDAGSASLKTSLMLHRSVGLKKRSMHFLQTFLLRRAFRGNHIWDWPFLVWCLHLSSSNSRPFHICRVIGSQRNVTCNVLGGYWCYLSAVMFWEALSNHTRLKLMEVGKRSLP